MPSDGNDMPAGYGEWAALTAIVGGFLAVVGWILRIVTRIDTSAAHISELRVWQDYMEERHLPQTYARKTEVDMQFRELRDSNARVEAMLREHKDDMKGSFHTLRTDLLGIYKKDFKGKG